MSECGSRSTMIVGEGERDIDSLTWKGNQISGLKAAAHLFGFRLEQPLLKEGGEGVAIKGVARGVVTHYELPIASQCYLRQPLPASCPARLAAKLLHADVLLLAVARQEIVDAEGFVVEPSVEILCLCLKEEAGYGQ